MLKPANPFFAAPPSPIMALASGYEALQRPLTKIGIKLRRTRGSIICFFLS